MVFIFDFDGLFYSGKHVFDYVKDWFVKNRKAMFPKLTDEQYERVIGDYPEFLEMEGGTDIANYIYMFQEKYPDYEISIDEYLKLQNKEIEIINFEGAHFVDVDFMESFTKKYPCYVVSNSSSKHVKFYMKKIGVNPKWFKEVISNKFEAFDKTKKHYYEEIAKNESAKPTEVYVFGDSFRSDIAPAKALGFNSHLVKDSHKLKSILEEIVER